MNDASEMAVASHLKERPGPVSATLVANLRDEARSHGILIWLDKDGLYSSLVDELRKNGGFPFPLLAYRGSFLRLVLELDGHADGVSMQPLVIHMPGFTEETIRQTPVFEHYCAGRRHRVGLESLIRQAAQGQITPRQLEGGLAAGLATLGSADAWLVALIHGETATPKREFPALPQLFDELASNTGAAHMLDDYSSLQAVENYLERQLGLTENWVIQHRRAPDASERETMVADIFDWALCAEFVHDLKRPPLDDFLQAFRSLPKPCVDAARELANHLREKHAERYRREADRLEAELQNEIEGATAADLGLIDTFRFEDRKVFAAALAALDQGNWREAARYALARTEERSFWVRFDEARRTGWRLVELAARLGKLADEHQDLLARAKSLEEAADAYAESGWSVDLAHRRLEQARAQYPIVRLDEFPALLQCLNQLRRVYRDWADKQSETFGKLCQDRGFLPEPALQQRNLFDEVVRPLVTDSEVTAYFCVDALRFEMGRQLTDRLRQKSAGRIALDVRLAELPTVTEVGMNVLAPVTTDGRLKPKFADGAISGFYVGQALVATPDGRRKAMHERIGGETCPRLGIDDILDRDTASLKKTIARSRLLLVHSIGIDKAGEEGVGLRHFDDELVRIHVAIERLREAGVRNFVVTADHGFLLQDDTTRIPLKHGRKIDPKRRHVFEKHGADHPSEIRVSGTQLRYEGVDAYIMFPATTMPFDLGARAKDFVHGGNSLQERLIPVIRIQHGREKGSADHRLRLEVTVRPQVAGMYRFVARLSLDQAQGKLAFAAPRQAELRLVALDGHSISADLLDATNAKVDAGILIAPVNQEFEVFFRLSGPTTVRSRVQLCGALGGDEIIPCELDRRFAVEAVATATVEPKEDPVVEEDGWLNAYQDPGVKSVFRHIQRYGAVNESEATTMLGNPRKFRRFSAQFESLAEHAPFEIGIDTASGQKRYVRRSGT